MAKSCVHIQQHACALVRYGRACAVVVCATPCPNRCLNGGRCEYHACVDWWCEIRAGYKRINAMHEYAVGTRGHDVCLWIHLAVWHDGFCCDCAQVLSPRS